MYNEKSTIKNLNITFGYSYFDIQSTEERIEIHFELFCSTRTITKNDINIQLQEQKTGE